MIEESAVARRSLFIIAVPVIFGCALLALLVAVLSRVMLQPSAWRAQVDYYLRYRDNLSYVSAVSARLPEAFTPEMSAAAYGSGLDFTTQYDTSGKAVGTRPASFSRNVAITQPLPYPPNQVWCVTLRPKSGAAAGEPRIVFVAGYNNLYSTEWITHEPAGDPATIMAAIGCP